MAHNAGASLPSSERPGTAGCLQHAHNSDLLSGAVYSRPSCRTSAVFLAAGLLLAALNHQAISLQDQLLSLQALSVTLRQQTLDSASRNIGRLNSAIEHSKATDAQRLRDEYQRLVSRAGSRAAGGPEREHLAVT